MSRSTPVTLKLLFLIDDLPRGSGAAWLALSELSQG